MKLALGSGMVVASLRLAGTARAGHGPAPYDGCYRNRYGRHHTYRRYDYGYRNRSEYGYRHRGYSYRHYDYPRYENRLGYGHPHHLGGGRNARCRVLHGVHNPRRE
jgi:hypothetical protein